ERQPRLRGQNNVDLPVAEHRVRPLALEVESLPLPERQIVQRRLREAMTNIEQAVATIQIPVARILRYRTFAVSALLQRHIVDRVCEGVGAQEAQSVRKALLRRHLQRMVIRIAVRGRESIPDYTRRQGVKRHARRYRPRPRIRLVDVVVDVQMPAQIAQVKNL